MNPTNWSTDWEKLERFAGQDFKAPFRGCTYLFHGDDVIEETNETRQPFLLAWPKMKLAGPGKPLSHCVTFTANELPEKP